MTKIDIWSISLVTDNRYNNIYYSYFFTNLFVDLHEKIRVVHAICIHYLNL